MPKRTSPYATRKPWRMYSSLPRWTISIRSSHHIFNSEADPEELIEGEWWLPHNDSLSNAVAARTNLISGGSHVVS
jgi:hypothetical protein